MATRKKKTVKGGRPKRGTSIPESGPITLEQAKALAAAAKPTLAVRRGLTKRAAPVRETVKLADVGKQRDDLEEQQETERERRIREYTSTMTILKDRGVKGLGKAAEKPRRGGGPVRRRAPVAVAAAVQPLQILAEGDSWFDYPVPLFGGGIITRLEKLVGIPILNLAKAGDEVRFMLGVKERKILSDQLKRGNPAGGPWDVLLFSGGGNDIVDNPMALWVRDFDPNIPAAQHLIQARFDAALALIRAGYEDMIAFRDHFSEQTRIVLHAYDFAIPDGRGVCFLGPWMKPTFDSHGFPANMTASRAVVKEMLTQFAAMLKQLEAKHPNVTVINAQGTLQPVPASWHNELHPKGPGFNQFAQKFHDTLKTLFPGRVL